MPWQTPEWVAQLLGPPSDLGIGFLAFGIVAFVVAVVIYKTGGQK